MSFVASDCACVVVNTRSRRKAFNKRLLLSAAAIALIAPSTAQANPVGGAVTTGSASISTSSSKTNVNQKSQDVVINWSSFNIGSGQTTQFYQPNAQAIAVNRVGGANASQILGTLDANGHVVLINGNGVLFGKGAQVNVGSLIATSTDGSDSDVLSGKFTQAGKQNASVVNNGTITAASGGMVALVAPNVTNTGTVNARLGTVALGAANKFTVDFAGDGLVSFAAQDDVSARASAVNSGLLSGTNVSMTAHAANGVATGVVNMSGIIQAQGVQNVGGTIYLNAGNGTLTTTGTLNATGATGGGRIETSGETANISGHITAGQGGQWKVDPEDLTIDSSAATTIDGALNNGTSVLEQTTSGAAFGAGNQTPGLGDINVESALSWNSTATLTLDAYHSLNIMAPISITGAGGLVLQYNDAATDGALSFGLRPTGFAGNVSYGRKNNHGTLSINGTLYTLLYSMTDVQNIENSASDNYALANSFDASPVSNFNPILLRGVFEGLGNTISNLKIDLPSRSNVGFFGGSSGTIRDFGLVGGSVDGLSTVGALVGENTGTVINTFASVPVSGGNSTNVYEEFGGLVGENDGTIENSHATGTVSGTYYVGGLAGWNNSDATISNSYATGAVSVAFNQAGGLVAENYFLGTISNSYATGAVRGGSSSDAIGGFAGINYGSITDSYASGTVSGLQTIGGFVGQNTIYVGDIGTIKNSYATGAVTETGGNEAGGLVGENDGLIIDDYATGVVRGAGYVGGLVSYNDGTVTDSYWDMQTTGQSASSGGTGLTTAQLQDTLPSGFSNAAWGTGTGLYPYLLSQFPSGTPQAISGVISSAGTDVVGQAMNAVVNGATIDAALSMSSGADGYYYLLFAPGTFSPSGGQVIVYGRSGGAFAGASFAEDMTGSLAGVNIANHTLSELANADDYSAVESDLSTAIGDNSAVQSLVDGLNSISIAANVPTFTVDAAIDQSGAVSLDTASNLLIHAAITAGSQNTLTLIAGGTIGSNSSGIITAKRLTGSSDSATNLTAANNIADLAGFTSSGQFSLTDATRLVVAAPLIVSGGTTILTVTGAGNSLAINGALNDADQTVDLVSAAGISQTSAGVITAGKLEGSAGRVTLKAANQISDLKAFTISSGDFALTDAQALSVVGTVDDTDQTGKINLVTTSGDLRIDGPGGLDASTVTLVSDQGEVAGKGAITTNLLNVTANTGIDLDGTNNDIGRIGTDQTNSGSNVIDQ